MFSRAWASRSLTSSTTLCQPPLFGEKSQLVGVARRLAVTAMIMSFDLDAVLRQEGREGIVARGMFGHAMGDEEQGAWRAGRPPAIGREIDAVAGAKAFAIPPLAADDGAPGLGQLADQPVGLELVGEPWLGPAGLDAGAHDFVFTRWPSRSNSGSLPPGWLSPRRK